MIIGNATNVIYNGATVESVIYNGSVVWPTAAPGPVPYSWSASGYTEVGTASAYNVCMPLNVRSFGWLTDTAAADTAVISGLPLSGAKYWAYSSQGAYNMSKSSTDGSSLQTAATHKNLMFDFTALCTGRYVDETYYRCITQLQLKTPFVNGVVSGGSITSVIDNHLTSSASSYNNYWNDISGSFHATAKSAKLVTTGTASFVALLDVSASGDYHTYRGHAGMTATWSGSGVYVP